MEKDELVTSIDVNWVSARDALCFSRRMITLWFCLWSLQLNNLSLFLCLLLLADGWDSILRSILILLHLISLYVTLSLIHGQVLHPLKDFWVLLAHHRFFDLGRCSLIFLLDRVIEPILDVLQSLLVTLPIIDELVEASGGWWLANFGWFNLFFRWRKKF